VCPWCWIEKRRLEKAAKALAGTVEVVVSQKSYRLARGLVPEDFSSALYKKFGNRIAADGMMDAVTQMGAPSKAWCTTSALCGLAIRPTLICR